MVAEAFSEKGKVETAGWVVLNVEGWKGGNEPAGVGRVLTAKIAEGAKVDPG